MKLHQLSSLILFLTPALGGCGKITSQLAQSRQDHLSEALLQCEQRFKPATNSSVNRPFGSCQVIENAYQLSLSYEQCITDAYNTSRSKNAVCSEPARTTTAEFEAADAPKSNTVAAAFLGNVRHQGIDEDDFVKVSAEHIFVSDGAKINVVDRMTKNHIGVIHLDKKAIHQTSENASLLVSGSKLVAVWQNQLSIFDVQNRGLPTLTQQKTLRNKPQELRLFEKRIVIVSSGHIPYSQNTQYNQSMPLDLSLISCATMYPTANGHFSKKYTEVELVPLNDIHQSQTLSFMGDNKLYMTDKNIYLYESHFGTGDKTQVRKVAFTKAGGLNLSASGEVKGRIKDVWALEELPSGELAVASSSGNLWDGSARNHFSVLSEQQGQLTVTGETPEFAPNENIRSVRFVGDIAYVVTFKKTDPLFAIDVSRPQEPKIISELKIPGFSTYMHPLSNDRLVGLGFDAVEQGDFALFQGLQLSLFDTSNPLEMSRKDVKIFGTRGSSSTATGDHRAFFMDPNNGVLAFPVSLIGECTSHGSSCQTSAAPLLPQISHSQSYTGAVVTRALNDRFSDPQFLTHSDLLPNGCAVQPPRWTWWANARSSLDVQRFFKIDGEMMSVSKSGLKIFRLGATVETLFSSRWETNCDSHSHDPEMLRD